jgi:hypothetical protein
MEGLTVADFLSDLASRTGISVDQAKQGMGALLSMLKDKVPADVLSQVKSVVPDSDSMMAAADTGQEASSGGGVFAVVKGVAEKLFGGGAGAALAKLQGAGLSAEQGHNFLHNVFEFLEGKLPEGVMNQLRALIPATETATK